MVSNRRVGHPSRTVKSDGFIYSALLVLVGLII